MDPAGQDRPRLDNSGHQLCNESINGTGFGDNIANNEHYGLTNFMALWNLSTNLSYEEDPKYANEFYNSMQSIWIDTTHLFYGGQGHSGFGGYGPDCRFAFPGKSDSLNWGPGCQVPNGPVDWTEYNSAIPPSDIRGIGGMGPFTFHPGDVQEVDLALIFARDYTGEDTVEPSVVKLDQMIDIVRNSYSTGVLPNGGSFFGIDNHSAISDNVLKIYPNPAKETVNLLFNRTVNDQVDIRILNTSGIVVNSLSLHPSGRIVSINVKGLPAGIYFINVMTKEFTTSGKLIILK
jgi:hypothetical protein